MSLDPRDSRRRGRSKSPGRRRDDDDEPRSHSKVRAPSPPSSRYAYDDETPSRKNVYDYQDPPRSGRDAGLVEADPRGYGYDPRGSDPRVDSYGGQYRTDPPYGPSGSRPEYAAGGYPPTTRADYAMPGSFTSMPALPDEGGRYTTAGGPGAREKDYYGEKGYGKRDKYERDDSPPRKERDKRYYNDDSYGRRDDHSRDSSPPRREKKEKSKYDDDSPPRSSRYHEDKYRDGRSYEDSKYGRDKYKDDDRSARGKYDDDDDKYAKGKYDDDDKYSKGKYDEYDKYGKGKYGMDNKYSKDKYEDDDRHGKEDRASRERGASFNISAGSHSYSGGVNVTHGHEKSQYYQPPSPPEFGQATSAYPKPDNKIPYTTKAESVSSYVSAPASTYTHQGNSKSYHDDPRSSKSQIVTVEPGSRNKRDSSPGPGAYRRDASPNPGVTRGMHSLSVSSGHHGSASLSLALAPGSPLLESYHGTYQSISPMPSPLMIAATAHSDVNMIEALSPESSDDEKYGKKKRNARFHDPVDEAKILAQALKGEKRSPDVEPLIEILPGLTHEQILDLRVEYKKIVKTGSEKKGVNIAKHIKVRLKEEDPSLMKACYACALGKWESEAYWANFWYQGEKSRRELLIESLMGRTNREIREIKDGFADKKYSDSLVKCMKTELKEDKFKKAVLLVLEEKKMEERPGYGVDRNLVDDDVRDLYKAVKSEKGGETAMISIIVVRSDSHLKEVLRAYEGKYRSNFSREMLKKSGNLVGELLAHILNGVINKPVRDALLVQHALSLSKSDSIRTELLISRLVRYHWDRPHMEAVKREYRNRYGVDMQKAVAEGTRGEWGHFCEMLCLRRMKDEVRRVENYRVETVDEYRIERR